MTSRVRLTLDELEWLHRQFASLARDTEGTREGRRWRHVHDWAWNELQRRRWEEDGGAPTNGVEEKSDG